jgi:tetratricopeptide (TPR) repeat protein
MTTVKIIAFAFLLLLLSGCQMNGQLKDDELQLQLDNYVAGHHYQRAIDLIAKQQPQTDEHTLRHRQLVDSAEHYRRSVTKQADGLAVKSRWVEALSVMQKGVTSYSSAEMRAHYDNLVKRRDNYLQDHWRRLNYQRASVIPQNITEINKLLSAQPSDKQADLLATQYAQESLQLLVSVIETAEINESKGRYTLAKTNYQLAKKLSLNKQYNDEISRLDAKLLALHRNKRQQQSQLKIKQKKKLESQFLASIASGDLLVAERQLAKVAELGIDSQRLQRYQEVLNQKIASAVSVLVIKANTAYTLGEIESAIVDWQQALALQPNNAVVVEKLARAKAFKNYYESLQLERLSSD